MNLMSTTKRNDLGLADTSCSCGSHSHKAGTGSETQLDSTTTTFGVAGMTCAHCVASVIKEVGKLAGAENVSVELIPGGVSVVTIASAIPLDRAIVAAAIDEAGYELVSETP